MDKEYLWINSNRSRIKRFKNNDKFFEYMFIDSGKILGVLGQQRPIMKTREELKI
tara:strand:- start:439 stop:603 length:165 start_codon:yes stop_codon:yes gene_type:complete